MTTRNSEIVIHRVQDQHGLRRASTHPTDARNDLVELCGRLQTAESILQKIVDGLPYGGGISCQSGVWYIDDAVHISPEELKYLESLVRK